MVSDGQEAGPRWAAMDQAGCLNSMTTEDLVETCKRLQRSCEDMTTLLSEFEHEQELLLHEQDRLHSRVEKVTSQVENSKRKEERGMLWSFLNEVDNRLEISKIFEAHDARLAAKRSKTWQSFRRARGPVEDIEDFGPFSDINVQKSWGIDVAMAVRQAPQRILDVVALERWVRDALCAESVAEADTVDMWMQKAQLIGDLNLSDCHYNQDESFEAMRPVQPSHSRTPSGLPGAFQPIIEASSEAETGESEADYMENDLANEGSGQVANLATSRHSVSDGAGSTRNIRSNLQSLMNMAADGAGAFMAAAAAIDMGPGDVDEVVVESLTVVLCRTSTDQKWGLGWVQEHFKQNTQRIIKQCVKDTVAGTWNKTQEETGHPERCIQSGDQLVSANGKTDPAEITKELSCREVVLEFHRTITIAAPAATIPPVQTDLAGVATPRGTPLSASATPKASPKAARAKASFSRAFSAYLEDKGVPPPAPTQKTLRRAATAPLSPTHEEAPASPTAAEPEAQHEPKGAESAAEDTVEDDSPTADKLARPLQEVPYGVVVQVLSLTSGSLRVSWCFDWATAPSHISSQASAGRAFEVLSCPASEGGEEEEAMDSAQASRKWVCTKPMSKLELPSGRRYSLKVRALLVDSQMGDASTSSAPEGSEVLDTSSLWASQQSLPAQVDLRSPIRAALPIERKSEASAGRTTTGSASDTSVTASTMSPTAGASPAASSSTAPTVAAPSGRSKRGAVASSLGSFLAQPATMRTASSPSASSVQPLVSRTTSAPAVSSPSKAAGPADPEADGRSPQRALTSSLGANRFLENPLNSAAPRVVAATAQSPVEEKREVAERLRMRRGMPLGYVDPREREVSFRSTSMDEDDSLQHLASALRNLQKSASDRIREDTIPEAADEEEAVVGERQHPDYPSMSSVVEIVAQEGHHGLSSRMDGASPIRPAHKKEFSLPLDSDPPKEENLLTESSSVVHPCDNGTSAAVDSAFRLRVQLNDGQIEVVEFARDEDITARMREFTVQNHLRELFVDALHERAALMVQSERYDDTVDIIDLL